MHTTFARRAPLVLVAALALPLAACGGMVDKEGMYEEFAASCKTSFEAEGGPPEMTEPFCECSTNKVREQDLGPMDMLDEEKMTSIGEACAQEVLANMQM
ncbi:MAG: hypothetical protein CL955_03910 [Erythrobacteraceae bacterium]|nr:hypothetical protein [Erythrobacteraceae bacterium]